MSGTRAAIVPKGPRGWVLGNVLVALGLLVGTTVVVGITVREEGDSLPDVALAGVLYAALMVPVVLPGLALYLATLRRLVPGRRSVEARIVAVVTAPLAVILLAPSLLVQFGPMSLLWVVAGTLALGLLARLPPHP